MHRFAARLLVCLLAALASAGTVALAQPGYPARAITLVVPFGPGSGSDTAARIIGERLAAALGQPVVIENKVGANGALAAASVARAAPDGYTFFIGTNSSHGSNPSLMKSLPYDPIGDFVPVVRVGIFIYFVVADPALPVTTMADLVALQKQRQLAMATGNTTSIVMGETFVRSLGLDPLRVPYRSVPQALTDIMAGRVAFMFADISSSIALVQAGSLRALAITSPERSKLRPDLPTIQETALPSFAIESWIGFFAPAKTPAAITERVAAEVTRILETPEMRKRLGELGVEPKPIGGQAFAAFVASEIELWTKLVRNAGIQAE